MKTTWLSTVIPVTPALAVSLAEEAVNRVVAWMREHHLELAAAKTDIVMVSKKKRNYKDIPVTINGVLLHSATDIKYLGVRIKHNLKWSEHVKHVTEKATRVATALALLMRRHSGPKCKKRRLLVSVVNSILRYGAPVWHEGVETREEQRLLERVQKRVVVGASFAFRTISFDAAAVIAGTVPIALLVKEDARFYHRRVEANPEGLTAKQIREQERLTTYRQWQDKWDEVG